MSVKQTPAIGKGKAGPGRKKGVPNKLTADVKAMILDALAEAGGIAYLVEKANDPRTASAFLTLVGKVLPMQVTGADGGPLVGSFTVKFEDGPGKPTDAP